MYTCPRGNMCILAPGPLGFAEISRGNFLAMLVFWEVKIRISDFRMSKFSVRTDFRSETRVSHLWQETAAPLPCDVSRFPPRGVSKCPIFGPGEMYHHSLAKLSKQFRSQKFYSGTFSRTRVRKGSQPFLVKSPPPHSVGGNGRKRGVFPLSLFG